MTKGQLQKELLEKVKEGVKPSDLKKKNIKPKLDKDEGYSSEEEEKNIPIAPPLPNPKIKELQNQITSLQKQLQTYKDFKEVDLKIKEKLKKEIDNYKETIKDLQEKNKKQYKTIQDLQNQAKNKENVKESTIKTFNCYNCKKQQALSLLVIELPEGKLCQSCWTTLRKKTKERSLFAFNEDKENKEKSNNPKPNQPFICIVCDKEKNEVPIYKKVDISYKNLIKGKEYPVCSTCSIHVKEYNENENRELDIWE